MPKVRGSWSITDYFGVRGYELALSNDDIHNVFFFVTAALLAFLIGVMDNLRRTS